MKKKIATFWLGGCSGCHMSLLDIDERLLELAPFIEIVKSPIVDGKELPPVDVAIVEGALCQEDHVKEIRHIRQQAKILVALGDCALNGNVSAMRNAVGKEAALARAYRDSSNNDSPVTPNEAPLGVLLDRVRPLHEVVTVDVFLPGCPPSADDIYRVLAAVVKGEPIQLPQVKNG